MMKISYKKFGAFAATAVLAGILAGCGSGMNADANDMARPAAMQQEKAAGRTQNFMDAKDADFMLTDVNGKEHRLSDYRGKKVYIKFWASWCSVCMATLADTDMLAGSDDKDFVVLSVVAPGFGGEMKKEDFVKWYKGLGYNNLPVLLDEGGAVTKKYGIRFYPSAALIDTCEDAPSGAYEQRIACYGDEGDFVKEDYDENGRNFRKSCDHCGSRFRLVFDGNDSIFRQRGKSACGGKP